MNLSQVNGGIVIDVSDLNSIKLDKKMERLLLEQETEWEELQIPLPSKVS